MIRQSPAVDGPVPREGELPERVSPFDLALYAAWADEDPGLTAERVDRGSDAYVEGRIIERLDDPLVIRALPVLASAGRCRVTTIAEFLGREDPEGRDATALGQRLAAQEWVDADLDPASGETVHVTARPALARRLRRYFGAGERRAGFAARNAALASFLAGRLRATPLADVDTAELLAALRLSAPEEAAALWDDIAGRAMQPPGRWGTVLNMTRRILGEWEPGEWEDGAWPTMPALRATVTAAHIAGSRRDSALFDGRANWEVVRAWAGRHPDPETRSVLLARALLALEDGPPSRFIVSQIVSDSRGLVATAAVDAAHRLLRAGRPGDAELVIQALPLAGLYELTSLRVTVWAHIAIARLRAGSDDTGAARQALMVAESLAESQVAPEPDWPDWSDWIAPEDMLARVRIELGLISPPDDLSVLAEWEHYAADELDSIERERLASLCLRIRLRHAPVDASVAEHWEALDGYLPGRAPTASAHDLVPPLCVSVAEAWMSAGKPDRALDLLGRRRTEALGTRDDQVTVRHAQATTMKIVRRLRIATQKSLLYQLMRDLRTRGDAWRACAIVHRESPSLRDAESLAGEQPGAAWHAWWQSQTGNWRGAPVNPFLGLTTGIAPLGMQVPADQSRVAPATLDDADLVTDLQEMLLLGHPGLVRSGHAVAIVLAGQSRPRPPARSADPYYDVRAAMRRAALDGAEFTPRDGVPGRLLAEMAFEEAELTALRLPEAGTRLFDLAAGAYQQAGDWIGYLLAVLAAADAGPGRRRDAAREAITGAVEALARQHPELAARLAGPVDDAGPWRYWAGRLTQLVVPQAASPGSEVTQAGNPRPGQEGPGSAIRWGDVSQPQPGSHAPYGQQGWPQQPNGRSGELDDLPGPAIDPVQPDHGPGEPGGARLELRRRNVRGVLVARLLALVFAGLAAYLVSETALRTNSGSPGGGPAHPTTWISYLPVIIVSAVAVSAVVALPPLVRRVSTARQSGDRASRMAKSATPPGRVSALALALRAVAGIVRRIPSVRQLADERGIGATRLRNLRFEASIGDTDSAANPFLFHLRVLTREWRTAPLRAKIALAFLAPAARLAARRPQLPRGYSAVTRDLGTRHAPLRLLWQGGDREVPAGWWRAGQGEAPGVIWMDATAAGLRAQPWERVLSASLSPEAAGRIEWTRIIRTVPGKDSPPGPPGRSAPAGTSRSPSPQVNVLQSPGAWASNLGEAYSATNPGEVYSSPDPGPSRPLPPADAGLGIRHVIGQAITTSAGPAMQVSDYAVMYGTDFGSSLAPTEILGIPELEEGSPQLVILQAIPSATVPVDGAPADDEPDKLALAAGLAEDGVPAILLLPVLPAALAPQVARVITAQRVAREGRGDAQRLLTRLRAIIAPHVPPQVLDDIVLFLNESRYQQ